MVKETIIKSKKINFLKNTIKEAILEALEEIGLAKAIEEGIKTKNKKKLKMLSRR
ncbi:MAG: hypothetical protein NC922_06840 [Candidatus Omnitrophica bacterium]|nr:hypothetical protein [Candidatus Omnitrophota bacterium]